MRVNIKPVNSLPQDAGRLLQTFDDYFEETSNSYVPASESEEVEIIEPSKVVGGLANELYLLECICTTLAALRENGSALLSAFNRTGGIFDDLNGQHDRSSYIEAKLEDKGVLVTGLRTLLSYNANWVNGNLLQAAQINKPTLPDGINQELEVFAANHRPALEKALASIQTVGLREIVAQSEDPSLHL